MNKKEFYPEIDMSKARLTDMHRTHILSNAGARSVYEKGKRVGYCVNLRISYYRGVPLSLVDFIELWVDGEAVPPEDMTVQCEGKEYPYLDIFKDNFETETWWRFGEYLRVIVKKDGGIPVGHHKVKLHVGVRCSYIPTREATYETVLTFA